MNGKGSFGRIVDLKFVAGEKMEFAISHGELVCYCYLLSVVLFLRRGLLDWEAIDFFILRNACNVEFKLVKMNARVLCNFYVKYRYKKYSPFVCCTLSCCEHA